MRKVLFLSLLLVASPGLGEESSLCEPVESRGEGHWPIPESRFTLESARESAEQLQSVLEEIEQGQGEEYFALTYAVPADAVIRNALVKIEGYRLRRDAMQALEQDSPRKTHAVSEFCEFLQDEAFVYH